jgi:hypothetical protein
MKINKPRPSRGVSLICNFAVNCAFLVQFVLFMQLGVAHDLALLGLYTISDDNIIKKKESSTTSNIKPQDEMIKNSTAAASAATESANTKPTLLLHLGPPKTSTTSLQCILTNMMDTLALDNYVYLGLHAWHCLKNETQIPDPLNFNTNFLFGSQEPAFAPSFLSQLCKAHEKGQNVIIMNECLNDYLPEQRQLIFDDFSANWTVKLIINYRRVYELLPSAYNQNHRANEYRSRSDYESLMLWPDETANHTDDVDGSISVVVGQPLLPFTIDDDLVVRSLLTRTTYNGRFKFGHPVSQVVAEICFLCASSDTNWNLEKAAQNTIL